MLLLALRPSGAKLSPALRLIRASSSTSTPHASGFPKSLLGRPKTLFPRRYTEDSHVVNVQDAANYISPNPIWPLVNSLSNLGQRWRVVKALKKYGVSEEQFSKEWEPVIFASDAAQAFTILNEKRLMEECPVWVLLHIASHLVKTPADGAQLGHIVLGRLAGIQPDLAPWLLIVSAHALSRGAAIVPLQRVVHAFLHLANPPNSLHFNHLLLAVARFPSSSNAARVAVTLLDAMTARQKQLRRETYLALLSDRFVTLELTKVLQQRMASHSVVPTAAHLERFLKVFAQNGSIHDARRYLNTIRKQASEEGRMVPYGAPDGSDESLSSQEGYVGRWNTQYLSGFGRDHLSAFEYLQSLIASERAVSPNTQTPNDEPRTRSRLSGEARSNGKATIDIHDWTAALSAAARDTARVPAKTLVTLFEGTPPSMHATTATYTTVVRGLAARKAFGDALRIWDQFENSRLQMDSGALAVGVQALASAHQPRRALELLERYSAPESETKLDVVVVNAFMTALLRTGQSDAVLKVWDAMTTLFGVSPDIASLTLMLDAARTSSRIGEQSVRGVLSQMAASLPSFSRKHQDVTPDRNTLLSELRTLLPDIGSEVTTASNGLWHGTPAWKVGRQIFRQVALGNYPELLEVQQPVAARRTSPNDAAARPLTDFARRWTASVAAGQTVHPLPTDTQTPEAIQILIQEGLYPFGQYPQIMPTDGAFRAYILLLGEAGAAAEIPQALAWARALDVKLAPQTLAAALVYWAEVSLGPPLMERDGVRGGASRYGALVVWLRDWVGEDGMPDDARIGRWLRKIGRMRDGQEPNGR